MQKKVGFSNRCNLRKTLNVEWTVDVILPGFWNMKNVLVSRLHCLSSSAMRKVLASYSPFVCSLVKRKKKKKPKPGVDAVLGEAL